jgi:lysophospholipase L1-like esterase
MKVPWNITKYLLLIILLFSYCSVPPSGIIILCAGDSITEAEYPLFLHKILKKEGIRAKVYNYGRSGFTSGEYLNFLRGNKSRLAAEQPDFILLQLGTNDVRFDDDSTSGEEFYSNMKEIIKIFEDFRNRSRKKSEILLATIPPIPEGSLFPFTSKSQARATEEINPFIKKISSEEKVTLVDNYSLFVQSPHLLPEVHPSREGYKHLAQNWYKALKPLLFKKAQYGDGSIFP